MSRTLSPRDERDGRDGNGWSEVRNPQEALIEGESERNMLPQPSSCRLMLYGQLQDKRVV